MKHEQLAVSILSLAALSFSSSGCNAPNTAFHSGDLANNTLPSTISNRDPVVLKMLDGNLMCVTQVGYRIHFFKTSSGYAEAGGEVNLGVAGGSLDRPRSNLYSEINNLEALAYFDNDWRKIYDAVADQRQSNSRSVDPKYVQMTLEPMVVLGAGPRLRGTGSIPGRASEVTVPWWLDENAVPSNEPAPNFLIPTPSELEEIRARPSEAVYIRLGSEGLLKVVEQNNQLHFYKTSSGYASSGAKVHIKGVGAGFEVPVSNLYSEISAQEAKAHLDGNWQKIYEAAHKQNKIIMGSVSPELIRRTFSR